MITVLYTILDKTTRLIAPILSFTAEEIYENMTDRKKESVHLEDFPKVNLIDDSKLEEKWDKLMKVRDDLLKALEESRNEKVIGKSLEASVEIYSDDKEVLEIIKSVPALHQLFIVSKVKVKENDGKKYDYATIKVEKALGHKCERCWTIVDEVTSDNLCSRCHDVVEKLK